jgi:alanine-glyoxylate transaminase/serine-glyoxylate transaminase/serine-pyruvate transaminase
MATLGDVFDKLRTIFRTQSWVTVLPGSGRVGLEACMVSVLEPGDHSVHVVNGAFGELAIDIARRIGAQVTVVPGAWGGPIDLDAVEKAIREVHPKLVTLVHSETSTGALYDPLEIGRISHRYGALFMMDAISSVANMRFDMDAMDCDLAVAASNKGIGALHGLAMVGVSQRAIQAMHTRKTTCTSWSLDLQRWNDMYFDKTEGRRNATPPPTHLVYSLQEACRLLLEEGLQAHWSRVHRFAQATRQAVQAAGLEIFPDRALWSDCVTAIRIPEGMEAPPILKGMEANGVLIAGAVARPSPISGRLLRISHQGIQASAEMLIPTLSTLERTLRHFGYPLEHGTMVGAFEACLESE